MNQEQRSLLLNSFPSHPAASSQGGKVIYGARGFSGDASLLEPTAFKAGILAALRSLNSQSVTGLMITASGDVQGSAGIRIIDPDGRMLTSQWKSFADSVLNVGDPDDFVALIEKLVNEENISFRGDQPAEIWLGRSTTPNGESLFHAAKQGISAIVGAAVHDMGVLTAPQLHWLVRAKNEGLKSSEHDYFEQLSVSYRNLADTIPRNITSENTPQKLVVYGATGVGGAKLEVLKDLCNGLEIDIQNTGEDDCTASDINFIEKAKIFASGFGPGNVELRFAGFDADAERLVYMFTRPSHNEIDVVHGDKVLSLFALFIRDRLNILDDDENQQTNNHCYSRLGIVQSASVGEASADLFKSLGFSHALLPGGDECLHEEATKYDVGIYATEDGRCAILFSERILSWLESVNKDLSSTPGGSRRQNAAFQLLAISKLMNHSTSDALGGLLLIEAILRHMGWSVLQWNDLPNMELDVVAVEESGIGGRRALSSLDDLSRCPEAISSEQGVENGMCGSHTQSHIHIHTQPIGEIQADPVKCESRTVDDSEDVKKESNGVDLTMYSVEDQLVGTSHDESEKQSSKELSAKIEEKVDSENTIIESDEAEENISDSTAEVEDSLGNCTEVQSDKSEIQSVSCVEELVEDMKSQLQSEHSTGQEPEARVTSNTSLAQMIEENVIWRENPSDKNVIGSRGAADDTQILEKEGDGPALVADSKVFDHLEASMKDKELVVDNESSPSIDPSLLEESCLELEERTVVDGDGSKADSDSESIGTVSKGRDTHHDNGVTETLVDSAKNMDVLPYINLTAAAASLKDLSAMRDEGTCQERRLTNDSAETCETVSEPAENGDSIVNFSLDGDVKAETEADNDDADVTRKLNGVVGGSSENGDSIVKFSQDNDVKFETKADTDDAEVNRKLNGVVEGNSSDINSDFLSCEVNGVVEGNSSDINSDFLSCEVNGVKELVNGTQILPVLSDVNRTLESGDVSVDFNHKSQVDSMSSVDSSSAVHIHMENEAGKQFNCVADDPGMETEISLSTSEVTDISVPCCDGEDLHSPSEAADTPRMESKITHSTSEAHEVGAPICNGEGLHSLSEVAGTSDTECKISLSTSEASEDRAPSCNGEDSHSHSDVVVTPGMESKIRASEDSEVAPLYNGEDPHAPSEVADTHGEKPRVSPSKSDASEVCAALSNGEGPHSPSEADRIEGPDKGAVYNNVQSLIDLIETKISLTSELSDAIAPCCNGDDRHSPSGIAADNPGVETKIHLSKSEVYEVSTPLCNGEHLQSISEVEKIEGPDNVAEVMSSQPAMNGVYPSNIHGANLGIECEIGPVHSGSKSVFTTDNAEGLIDPSAKEAVEKLETEAENGSFGANELGSAHGSDDNEPESQLNITNGHVFPADDATSEYVADDAEVGLDGRPKDQHDDFTSGISFGSFTSGDLVGNLSIQGTDGANEGNGCLGDGDNELSESDSVEATSIATKNSPEEDAASVECLERGSANNDGEASNELICTNEAPAEVPRLSPKVSADDAVDGENVDPEDVKLPFYYLIKMPRYEDSELSNQKKLAEVEVEERTRKRDAIQSECRKTQEIWSELKRSVDAAIQEERDVRDQIRAKRKQIDSAQALVDIARDAMTIEDLDRKVADMEHKIQHETMPLREEKDLIREIKQSKQLREQLRLASSKKQGVQQALDDKDKNKEHSKVLRKEIDALRERLSQLEQTTKAARTKFDEETKKLNELRDERHSANAVRNQAFSNLILLRKQWSEKAKHFYQYKENQSTAYRYAANGDKELLQQHCVNQVETMMTLWNTNDDFRRDYVRCNKMRILRNFGTLDGRALGPEEPALLRVVDRTKVNASAKEVEVSKDATAYPPLVSKAKETDKRSLEKVVARKNPDDHSSEKVVERVNPKNIIKIADRSIPVKVDTAEASSTIEKEEDQEAVKRRQEEEEVARKAEELRKEEEAAKLKERLRQEEKEKAQQALERKRRQAEKAQAKAEAKAKKEAELKEKEREKKARKKEKKKAGNAETSISKPETETEVAIKTEVSDEHTKEPETKEQQRSIATTKRPARTQYTKQSKIIKSIAPPPPPLRNRGKRRMQQWMWVLFAVAAAIGLFFLGNGNFALIRELFDSFN